MNIVNSPRAADVLVTSNLERECFTLCNSLGSWITSIEQQNSIASEASERMTSLKQPELTETLLKTIDTFERNLKHRQTRVGRFRWDHTNLRKNIQVGMSEEDANHGLRSIRTLQEAVQTFSMMWNLDSWTPAGKASSDVANIEQTLFIAELYNDHLTCLLKKADRASLESAAVWEVVRRFFTDFGSCQQVLIEQLPEEAARNLSMSTRVVSIEKAYNDILATRKKIMESPRRAADVLVTSTQERQCFILHSELGTRITSLEYRNSAALRASEFMTLLQLDQTLRDKVDAFRTKLLNIQTEIGYSRRSYIQLCQVRREMSEDYANFVSRTLQSLGQGVQDSSTILTIADVEQDLLTAEYYNGRLTYLLETTDRDSREKASEWDTAASFFKEFSARQQPRIKLLLDPIAETAWTAEIDRIQWVYNNIVAEKAKPLSPSGWSSRKSVTTLVVSTAVIGGVAFVAGPSLIIGLKTVASKQILKAVVVGSATSAYTATRNYFTRL